MCSLCHAVMLSKFEKGGRKSWCGWLVHLFLLATKKISMPCRKKHEKDIYRIPIHWQGQCDPLGEAANSWGKPILPVRYLIWVVVSKTFFYFHPYFGKIPSLTNIFQLGWNHQLVTSNYVFFWAVLMVMSLHEQWMIMFQESYMMSLQDRKGVRLEYRPVCLKG